MTVKKPIFKALIYILMTLFGIIQVFPFIWSVLFSFKSNSEIVMNGALSLPTEWKFTNYINAWTRGHIGSYFFNSLIVSVVSTTAIIILSSMCAYAFTRMKWELRSPAMTLIMSGLMIPIQAILIPQFFVIKGLGMTKTYLSVILPYIGAGLPLGIFIISGFMAGLPKEVEEAALLDGCGIFKAFFHIVLHLIKPALATVGVLTFINCWNEMIMAVTYIYNDSLKTLPVGLMAFQGTHATDWGALGAAMVIASLPAILFYFKFGDLIEDSVTMGAILK